MGLQIIFLIAPRSISTKMSISNYEIARFSALLIYALKAR